MFSSQALCLTVVACGSFAYQTGISGIRPRVIHGIDDRNNEYPYVVSIQEYSSNDWSDRVCSGSLISAEWVLTAAHCMHRRLNLVRYGDMTIRWNETKSYSKVLEQISHPSYLQNDWLLKNDIALILVQRISLTHYGRVSALDYKTLTGLRAKYAGFGFTFDVDTASYSEENRKDHFKPLQIGDAAIIACDNDKSRLQGIGGPLVCTAPPCANRKHIPMPGDSGGPLLVANKIVGVLCASLRVPIDGFTPVSPYLDWIHDVMSKR